MNFQDMLASLVQEQNRISKAIDAVRPLVEVQPHETRTQAMRRDSSIPNETAESNDKGGPKQRPKRHLTEIHKKRISAALRKRYRQQGTEQHA